MSVLIVRRNLDTKRDLGMHMYRGKATRGHTKKVAICEPIREEPNLLMP